MTDTTETTEHRSASATGDRTRIERYDPTAIEPRWQARWAELGLHETDLLDDDAKPKYYLLTMYPYPSGDLHIGHWYIVTPTDALARFRRMHGYNVFFPIGFDAFGLPAENAAIKSGGHPFTWTMQNIENMRRQFRTMGATFAWDDRGRHRRSRVLPLEPVAVPALPGGRASPIGRCRRSTGVPTTGRWRASRSRAPTVTAGAAARWSRSATWSSGSCARPRTPTSCSTSPASTGPSRSGSSRRTGSAAPRAPRSTSRSRPTTTSRAATGCASSRPARTRCSGRRSWSSRPEHPLVATLTHPDRRAEVEAYVEQARRRTEIDRLSTDREKTGVAIGADAINPVNGERIPIFIADYVLAGYGTGAIMAVPAHDERDFEFARKFGLAIRRVVAAPGVAADAPMDDAYIAHAADERLVNSGRVRRAARRRGRQGDRRLAGRDRPGRAEGHLPPARLADQPPALLGHADPGHLLRARRHRAGPGRGPAGPPARDRRLRGQRRQPAQPRRGVPARRLPALRRPGPARDRHDGHVHGLVVVLVPLPVARRGRTARSTAR